MSPDKLARMVLVGSAVAGFLGLSATPASAATITVNSTADPGTGGCDVTECTLREAIAAANASSGISDVIAFNIPGTGQHTIAVTGSQLPTINDPVTVDGFSDPDDAGRIEIDGTALTGAQGLVLGTGSSGSTVKGLVINDFGEGIFVVDPNMVIEGNYVGTMPSGNAADANATGIRVAGASATIGGTTVAARNVISGNTTMGLVLQGSSAQVLGNYIGLGADGATDLGHASDGVSISGNSNTIGGTTTTARNVISGNDGSGVSIFGTASSNLVQGNYIGVDSAGTTARANADGVFISGSAVGNTVGGSTTTVGACDGACNVIAGNVTGVYVASGVALSPNAVRGNLIGIDAGGAAEANTSTGVAINGGTGTIIGGSTANQRNVISGNGNGGGIFVQPSAPVSGLQITGNYIGLAPNGLDPRPNAANGILLNGVNNVTVTGTTIQGNVISSNTGRGIFATNPFVESIAVQGNTIGLAADGSTARGNVAEGFYSHVDVTGPVTVGGAVPSAGNVISGNANFGLYLRGLATYTVSGNRVGTDATGTAAVPNTSGGMYVQGSDSLIGGDNATPGGQCSGSCNLVSGNAGFGIAVSGDIEVQGNYVGTNLAGDVAVPNTSYGICECSTDSGVAVIGGTTAAQRNVIAGNDGPGIAFPDPGAINNEVHGNYIGIGADGVVPLGNQAGVLVTAPDNQVGGPGAEANEIAHNEGVGVWVAGANADENSILGNSIHDNGELGIDLGTDGLTPNDIGDADAGPNDEQNFPVLTGAVASGSQTAVTGTLDSTPSQTFDVEIFSSPSCDASGNGEGETYLATTQVTTNPSGDGTFTTTIPSALAGGSMVTATATDQDGSTSEFSACLSVTIAPPAPPVPLCLGTPATIVGTNGNDVLNGTPGADVIAALGGNDVIAALGGNDLVCAGDGKDKANGGSGKDRLAGEAGNDKLKGGGGNDRLIGGPGKDTASGGPGKDKAPGSEKTRGIP